MSKYPLNVYSALESRAKAHYNLSPTQSDTFFPNFGYGPVRLMKQDSRESVSSGPQLKFLTDLTSLRVDPKKILPTTGLNETEDSERRSAHHAAVANISYALQDGDVYILITGSAQERTGLMLQSYNTVKELRRCVYVDSPTRFTPGDISNLRLSVIRANLIPSVSPNKVTLFINNGDDLPDCFLQFLERIASDGTDLVAQVVIGSTGDPLGKFKASSFPNFERRLAVRCNLAGARCL